MNLFTRVICLILMTAALSFFVLQSPISSQIGSSNTYLISRAENITGDKFPIATKTARGVVVRAVSEPTDEELAAIDKGFDDLFKIAKRLGYRKKTRHSAYTVFLAKPDRTKSSTGAYSPDIAVKAGQYKGSKYDKGGFVYAAGIVVAFEPAGFAIAHHKKMLDRVSEVVRYEGEHIVLYHNDRKKFRETADHSKKGGHPILK